MLSKGASCPIFWVFAMTWPGIEPRSLEPLVNILTLLPMGHKNRVQSQAEFIPKAHKMVLDTFLLITEYHKVGIKGKWCNPRKWLVLGTWLSKCIWKRREPIWFINYYQGSGSVLWNWYFFTMRGIVKYRMWNKFQIKFSITCISDFDLTYCYAWFKHFFKVRVNSGQKGQKCMNGRSFRFGLLSLFNAISNFDYLMSKPRCRKTVVIFDTSQRANI